MSKDYDTLKRQKCAALIYLDKNINFDSSRKCRNNEITTVYTRHVSLHPLSEFDQSPKSGSLKEFYFSVSMYFY